MVEDDAFDKMGYIARLQTNTIRDLVQRLDEDVFELVVHIAFSDGQSIFEAPQVNTKRFVEEASKENGVAGFVDELGGEEDAHFIVGHGGDVGGERVRNAFLSFKE